MQRRTRPANTPAIALFIGFFRFLGLCLQFEKEVLFRLSFEYAIRTRPNTSPNGTEASAPGRCIRACVSRESKRKGSCCVGKRVMRLMGGRGVGECESEGTLVGWRDLLKKAGFFAWRSPAEVSCSAAQPSCVGGRAEVKSSFPEAKTVYI